MSWQHEYWREQEQLDKRDREERDAVLAHVEESQKLYRANWPHHCRNCGGWGSQEWREDGQRFCEPCDGCIGQNVCPRCGEHGHFWNEETETIGQCAFCGWTDGTEGEQSL